MPSGAKERKPFCGESQGKENNRQETVAQQMFSIRFNDIHEVNEEEQLRNQREKHNVSVCGAYSCHCEMHKVK